MIHGKGSQFGKQEPAKPFISKAQVPVEVKPPTRSDVTDWMYRVSNALRKETRNQNRPEKVRLLKIMNEEFKTLRDDLQ